MHTVAGSLASTLSRHAAAAKHTWYCCGQHALS